MLIASTSEVYGKSTKIPFCEDDDLVMGGTQKGRWSYACSKAIDEFLALAYWKEKRFAGGDRAACSIPSARARPAATAWCCPALCARRSRANR